MNRLEHIIPAGIITAVGLWVAFISFTQQPSEAFTFPRLISAVFVILSVWVLVQSLIKDQGVAATVPLDAWKKILPGLVVAAVYVFWAAKGFGFYTASSVAVFILLCLYDPAPLNDVKAWGKRLLITAGFMAILYGLFAKLLTVYTPREIYF